MSKNKNKFDLTTLVKNDLLAENETLFYVSDPKLSCTIVKVHGHEYKVKYKTSQKLAIARFFYRNAPLVIFDEPTASIDAESEFNIFNRIYTFFKNIDIYPNPIATCIASICFFWNFLKNPAFYVISDNSRSNSV